MASLSSRSIGSLQTWEPPDKSFSKHLLNECSTGTTPNDGSVCVVNMIFINPEDAEAVDHSSLGGYQFGEDVEITIGEGDTLLSELLDKVVCSMKEGETAYIKCKTDVTGAKIEELAINSKSGLKFNARVISVSRSAECADLEPDERLERAQHFKDRGTELFKDSRLEFAMKRYEKAVFYVSSIESSSSLPGDLCIQYTLLKCQCYLNLAACYLKKDQYDKVVEQCSKALQLEPKNVKGLFRKGQAHMKLNDYGSAIEDFKKARQIEPENKAVANQITAVNALIKKEQDVYKKMFS